MRSLLLRLPALFLFLQCLPAYAIEEVPVERASPIVVIGFLVLLVGACVGYGVYLRWSKKQEPGKDQ